MVGPPAQPWSRMLLLVVSCPTVVERCDAEIVQNYVEFNGSNHEVSDNVLIST